MRNLIEDEHANVIVCFCEGMTIRGLLQAMKEMNLTHRFLIIGSDGWADRQEVVCVCNFLIIFEFHCFTFHQLKVTNYEQQALGSISIRIHSPPLDSFDDYYFGLNPYNNSSKLFYKTLTVSFPLQKCVLFLQEIRGSRSFGKQNLIAKCCQQNQSQQQQ